MDVELCVWERKYEFERWEENSIVFRDVKRIMEEEKRANLLDSIASCARERWFLLNIKSKFAGKGIVKKNFFNLNHANNCLSS